MPVNIPGDSRVVTRGRVIIGPSSYGMTAEGGDLVQDTSISGTLYRIHTFTNSGILTVTTGPTGTATIEYLLVGGGGGGGTGQVQYTVIGGGGGAGGFIAGSLTLLSSGNYTITIGNGGGYNSNGANTVLSSSQQNLLIAYGGGAGGSGQATGISGGSGGGGGAQLGGSGVYSGNGLSLFSQGTPGGLGFSNFNSGESRGGGGGGAGGAGSPANAPLVPSTTPSDGGSARETFFRGFPEWFAAGGGGANYNSNSAGRGGLGGVEFLGGRGSTYNPGTLSVDGKVNTGSGGGGGYFVTSVSGLGGKGIAIIRYRIS